MFFVKKADFILNYGFLSYINILKESTADDGKWDLRKL